MSEAEKIADKLTEAQINLLFYWPKGLFSDNTYQALRRKGLVEGRTVTPLGLEVRKVLSTRTNGGDHA